MTALLSCEGISKTFLHSTVPMRMLQEKILRRKQASVRIPALQDISFLLRRGEWLGLYGHNGSGKTTLLKILAGLLPPDRGRVTCHGTLSCFFELGVGFHPELRAEENIRFHGLLQGLSDREIKNLSGHIMEFADVDSHRSLPLKCYSTGMRMRLGFAASVYTDADIYLMDEILAVGDAAFREKCWRALEERKAEGKTMILVNHQLEDLEKVCDRIITLDQGRTVGERILTAATLVA